MYHLISPSRGVENLILEGWNLLNDLEKAEVEERIGTLFADGLPFEVIHDKSIYLHIFSLLSQLEVVALQLPLMTLPHINDKTLQKVMRQQLVDEIFHAIIFSKIACEMSFPYGYPPMQNECIDKICAFIRDEKDVGTAIVLLNLVAESWFEEMLESLIEEGFAPKVLNVILQDEHRHIGESELYQAIGLPEHDYLKERVSYFENELMGNLVFQQKFYMPMMHVLGRTGCFTLVKKIHSKHIDQLEKINMSPQEKWEMLMSTLFFYLSNSEDAGSFFEDDASVEASPTRKILMHAWKPPINPTMYALFSLNVSRVGVFENKYPPQALTGLVLQAMSKVNQDNPDLRNYVVHHKMYNIEENYVHLVVNLPGATNHLAMLKLKNCHELPLNILSDRIQNYIQVMSYARYKSEELSLENPELLANFYEGTLPDNNDPDRYIEMPESIISLTNVGPWSGEQSLSPLLPFETFKLTMSQVDRKQVWNNKTKAFEVQDKLPIGLSADHRVFDANMGTPKMFQIAFDEMVDNLEQNFEGDDCDDIKEVNIDEFIELSNKMLANDLDWSFRYLMGVSHRWQSDIDLSLLHQKVFNLKHE